MAHYAREEIMSSSELVRNFGAVLSSVAEHKREKVAIIRNNRLEAVILAVDVYERLENARQFLERTDLEAMNTAANEGNSVALLDFLRKNHLPAALRMSPEEIDRQIIEEREAWD